MALITKTHTFSAGAVIVASQHNTNFDTLYNWANGNVDNDNIAASAAIAATKLNLATIAQTIAMSGAAQNWAKGSDIASATTTDIGAATGNYIDVTGTTTITGLGTVQAGTIRFVRFTGALTLTHNGTSLLLPSAANITTVANDTAAFVSLGSGNWKCLWYQRYTGSPLVALNSNGNVVQVVNTITGAVATGTTVMVDDDTIPQITEGIEFMTLAITPTSTTNKLKIEVVTYTANSGVGGRMIAGLFQDATANALAAADVDNIANTIIQHSFTHYMAAGTTSATTFRVRVGASVAGTTTFNGSGSARLMGGVMASSITITEIKSS